MAAAVAAPRQSALPLSGFVLISRILTDSAAPQMFNSLKRQTAFGAFQGGAVLDSLIPGAGPRAAVSAVRAKRLRGSTVTNNLFGD